jgi:hypothetical protein
VMDTMRRLHAEHAVTTVSWLLSYVSWTWLCVRFRDELLYRVVLLDHMLFRVWGPVYRFVWVVALMYLDIVWFVVALLI